MVFAPINTIHRRLTVLTAVALLPLTLLAGAGVFLLVRQQDVQARHVGLELAHAVAATVDTELANTIELLEVLATEPSLDTGDIPAFTARAQRVIAERAFWSSLILFGPDGTMIMNTRYPQLIGSPPVEPDSLRRVAATRRPSVGNLGKLDDGEWVFPVRVPVIRGGELKFVLTATMRPEAIRRLLTRQDFPSDWIASIVDANGRRVARSRAHEENLGGRLAESARRIVDGGGAEGFGISTTLEGVEMFTPYSRINAHGWVAVLGFPTSLVRAAAWRAGGVVGGGVLLSILLGTLGASRVARGITRPMAQLRVAAEALGRREQPSVPVTSLDEVAGVGMALQATSQRLQEYQAEREDLLRSERAAREAAENADRAKQEFMAVLSHELRTPLNAVCGWARLLQGGQLMDAALEQRAKDAIVRNADAQVRLIDDLLDLARISSGKMHLTATAVWLPQVLQAAVEAVRPSADAKAVAIRMTVAEDCGPVVGDAARLQQIVCNLLVNAVKFTPSGGTVTLALAEREGNAVITVSDTGQGIAPEMLPHVFERFRQADSSSTRRHGGLGLGLALVKHLTELHGGEVSADSRGVGLGATFTVTLPLESAFVAAGRDGSSAAAVDADALSRVTRLDGLRVLLVDDEPDSLGLAELILKTAGAVVMAHTCAHRAIAAARVDRPDVVISDIEMPETDGYALIRALRAILDSRVPAIALTAYGRPEDRLRALTAGFTMHVPKPVNPGELTAIVASLVATITRRTTASS